MFAAKEVQRPTKGRKQFYCAYLKPDPNRPSRDTKSTIVWVDGIFETPEEAKEAVPKGKACAMVYEVLEKKVYISKGTDAEKERLHNAVKFKKHNDTLQFQKKVNMGGAW